MENKNKKNIKNKSFYFKDYIESDFIHNDKNSNIVKVSLNRVSFITFIFNLSSMTLVENGRMMIAYYRFQKGVSVKLLKYLFTSLYHARYL